MRLRFVDLEHLWKIGVLGTRAHSRTFRTAAFDSIVKTASSHRKTYTMVLGFQDLNDEEVRTASLAVLCFVTVKSCAAIRCPLDVTVY